MTIVISMVWREEKDHLVYKMKISGITDKARHTVKNPDLPSPMTSASQYTVSYSITAKNMGIR